MGYEKEKFGKEPNYRLIGAAVIVIIVIGIVIGMYNDLATSRRKVMNKEANVAVKLTERADKIEELVKVVKGYTKHEEKCIEAITNARIALNNAVENKDYETAEKASAVIDKEFDNLIVSVESNPELKADKVYTRLMDEVAGSENRIAIAREECNDAATSYNTKLDVFPTSIIGAIFGFDEYDVYKAPAEDREAPEINFD